MRLSRIMAAFAAASVLCLAGCSLLATNPQAPQVQSAKLGIQWGVGRYLSSRPEEKRATSIERIKVIVGDVQKLATGESVTLALLREEVQERLPTDLRPEDLIAINGLLDIIMSTLEQCVEGGAATPCGLNVRLSPETRLALDTVAGWILEAVSYYPTANIEHSADSLIPVVDIEPKRPLTAIVITQCNLIVAAYLTMPDGRLVRFDKSTDIPADQLLAAAYDATHSERIEVSCNENGLVGYEQHAGPV